MKLYIASILFSCCGVAAQKFLRADPGSIAPIMSAVIMLSGAGSVALSTMRAAETNYVGIDFRVGLAAGWTFFERLTPYAVVRAFGGPVFYGSELGTDAYHVQLGAGLVVGLPFGFDLSAEIVPLGEQRVTAGLGYSF